MAYISCNLKPRRKSRSSNWGTVWEISQQDVCGQAQRKISVRTLIVKIWIMRNARYVETDKLIETDLIT